jgi:hypothetical protein
MLLNESSSHHASTAMTSALYDFGLSTPTTVSDNNNAYHSQHQQQQQVHLIAPNAANNNDILLSSLFQHEHSLLFSSLGAGNQATDSSFINNQSQQHQHQADYNFYYFNNATNSIDAQNFI